MQVDPTALMDGTYFVSRQECLTWLNGELNTNEYTKVEMCASAVPYLHLAKRVFPTRTNYITAKIKLHATTEYDRVHNWKILQDVLFKAGFTRILEVEKLARGTHQVNLEFLQWFKRIYETRRSTSPLQDDDVSSVTSGATTGTGPLHSIDRTSLTASTLMDLERRYYFEKLRRIEQLALKSSSGESGPPSTLTVKELADEILTVLYTP